MEWRVKGKQTRNSQKVISPRKTDQIAMIVIEHTRAPKWTKSFYTHKFRASQPKKERDQLLFQPKNREMKEESNYSSRQISTSLKEPTSLQTGPPTNEGTNFPPAALPTILFPSQLKLLTCCRCSLVSCWLRFSLRHPPLCDFALSISCLSTTVWEPKRWCQLQGSPYTSFSHSLRCPADTYFTQVAVHHPHLQYVSGQTVAFGHWRPSSRTTGDQTPCGHPKCPLLFFLDNAALVITTVAVMKIC